MRNISVFCSVLFSIANAAVGASAEETHVLPIPKNHEQALINAFEIMCNLEPPNLDRLAERATAMRMQPQDVAPLNLPSNLTLRRKAWNGKLTTGPFSFLVDETSGPMGTITTCAIASSVPDVNAFRGEVMRELRLSTEPQPTFLGGHRAFIFKNFQGDGSGLVIEDLTPSGQPSVMIKLSSLKKSN
ncbi:hypothetical protein [Methylocystis sp.]|uniref:hypothetical protein n=1 Tax=Methylocystis sp. TaxID=1911079 RepID=UPI003DA53A97